MTMKTLTMKGLFTSLTFLFLTQSIIVNAQENKEQECNIKYNLFRVDAKNKNYDLAYDNWLWTFENCPDLSINVYKIGSDIADYRYQKAISEAEKQVAKDLVIKVFKQRLQYYPNDNPAKIYSDWADFLYKTGSPETEYFELFEKAYKTNPEEMGVKAIPLYYEGIIKRNKDNNVQFIFDMYDNLTDVINRKVDNFSKKLEDFQTMETNGVELSDTQKNNKVAFSQNMESLGLVASLIADMSGEFETCERLIPLYQAEFEAHKQDLVWLKRSVSRLAEKGCTDSEFYDMIVETYVNVDGSCDSFIAYAGLMIKKGDENKALEYFKKAVDCQEDKYKKADILYNIAIIMKNKGRSADARTYAYQALESRPNLGKAYLLIASMYASSARSCSNGDVFTERMVYQAALEKAYKAKAVDPSIASQANKAIASYASKAPTTEDVFNEGEKSGSSRRINCWINESVRIP